MVLIIGFTIKRHTQTYPFSLYCQHLPQVQQGHLLNRQLREARRLFTLLLFNFLQNGVFTIMVIPITSKESVLSDSQVARYRNRLGIQFQQAEVNMVMTGVIHRADGVISKSVREVKKMVVQGEVVYIQQGSQPKIMTELIVIPFQGSLTLRLLMQLLKVLFKLVTRCLLFYWIRVTSNPKLTHGLERHKNTKITDKMSMWKIK